MPEHKLKSKLDGLSYTQQQKLKAYAKKRLKQIKSRDEGELAAALKIGQTPVFKTVINAALGQIQEGSEAMKRAITSSISDFYIEQEKKISFAVQEEKANKAKLVILEAKLEKQKANNKAIDAAETQVEIDKTKGYLTKAAALIKEIHAETRKGTLDQAEIAADKEEDLVQQLVRRSHKQANALISELLSGVPIKINYQKDEMNNIIALLGGMVQKIESQIDAMNSFSMLLTSWKNKLGAEADALKAPIVALLETSIAHLEAQSLYFNESLLAPFSEALQAFIDSKDLKHKTGWSFFKRKKTVDEGGPLVPWEMVNTVFKLWDTTIQYKASLEMEGIKIDPSLQKRLDTLGITTTRPNMLSRINSFLLKCVTESQLKDEHALRLRLDDCRQAKANGQFLSWRKVAAKPFDVPKPPKQDKVDLQRAIDTLNTPKPRKIMPADVDDVDVEHLLKWADDQ